MAKVSSVERNKRIKKKIESLKKKRQALKEQIYNKNILPQERLKLILELSKMPRDSSPVRHRNRCAITGRPRGYFRKFGLCRNKVREYAGFGMLAGVIKASW